MFYYNTSLLPTELETHSALVRLFLGSQTGCSLYEKLRPETNEEQRKMLGSEGLGDVLYIKDLRRKTSSDFGRHTNHSFFAYVLKIFISCFQTTS